MEIIAEIGQNHNGDMKLACELIHAARESGANAVKFQVYDAKSLFPKENNDWYDYNCKTELNRDQLDLLVSECDKVGIEFMASAFDTQRVSWLEEIGVKRHKLASRSIGDKSLVDAMVETKKPLLASLGMWNHDNFPVIKGIENVCFLYCVSKYPTSLEDLKLSRVDFSKYGGFSDHSIGITAAITACTLGARILEKHFTLDKSSNGPDHSGSMVPFELKEISRFTKEFPKCLK